MIEITISNDPATLGPEATEADLEQYAAALAEYLAEVFGVDEMRWRLASVWRSSAAATDGEFELAEQVGQRLREIAQTDEWLQILQLSWGES